MGVSMAKVTSVSTHSLSSNKITLQAHQFASDKAEFLKSETYSSLASQGKKSVTGSLYYDEVTVGKETAMPSNPDIKQKPCRVNVYYGDESIPRATLSFNRYSVEPEKISVIPIGTVIAFAGNGSPSNDGTWLECNGQSCAAYPKLVSVLGKSTLPDYRNRFLEGSGAAGTVIEAGLPNITGYIPHDWLSMGDGNPAGAFYRTDILGRSTSRQGKKDGDWFRYMFDASRSSSIYGRSSTVQPPAVTVRYFIKAA